MTSRWRIAACLLLLSICAACDLSSKSGCIVDGDCINGLTCIQGTCYDCAADLEGCGCIEGSCVGGLLCSEGDVCVSCSESQPCPSGLACDQGSCVSCSNAFAGCPCVSDTCGSGLRCDDRAICVALTCDNATRDGDETDVDCGGSCEPCDEEFACTVSSDCSSLACLERSCLAIGTCVARTEAYPTVQAAIEDPGCSTVQIPSGPFAEQLIIDRPITLSGEETFDPTASPTEGRTVLIGSVRSSLLTVLPGDGEVRLRNLVFREGEAAAGGAVRSERDLVIERCAFIDNRAETVALDSSNHLHACGGAIKVSNAKLVVRDSVFWSNTASEVRDVPGPAPNAEANGGAICVIGDGEVSVERSEFLENHAVSTTDVPGSAPEQAGTGKAHGGAIYREPGALVVLDSTFSDNVSRAVVALDLETNDGVSTAGGAIYAPSTNQARGTRIERSTFVENIAHADAAEGLVGSTAIAEAGAVFADFLELREVTFQDNLALAEGSEGSRSAEGAARMTIGRIESSNFWRNVAEGGEADAGAVGVLGRTAILNSVFWNNVGWPAAAVKAAAPDSDVWVINSSFIDNLRGCGVHADQGLLRLMHNASTDASLVCGAAANVRSEGYNVLSTQPFPQFAPHPDDRVWVEPRHEKIFNPSPRPGFPLLESPLVDGGRLAGCLDEEGNPVEVDNRGVPRAGPCDIGAFSVPESQELLEEPKVMLLQEVTSMQPDLYFPNGGECLGADTFEALSFARGEILGDNERPPVSFRDGFIDYPVVFRTRGSIAEGTASAELRSNTCTTPIVNCNDDLGLDDDTDVVFSDFELRTEGECASADGTLRVPAGLLGCIEGSASSGTIHVGFPIPLVDAEIVGSFDVGWTDELFATIRGFLSLEVAQSTAIPPHAVAALGGAEYLSDLLCDSDAELHEGEYGVFITMETIFRHTPAVTQEDLLPPLRLELFE